MRKGVKKNKIKQTHLLFIITVLSNQIKSNQIKSNQIKSNSFNEQLHKYQ